jgi:hypothetical protein
LITVGVNDLTLGPYHDKISSTTTKEKNMATLTIGDTFTTRKSGVTGTIQEIIEKPFGFVLRLDVNGVERFTTV